MNKSIETNSNKSRDIIILSNMCMIASITNDIPIIHENKTTKTITHKKRVVAKNIPMYRKNKLPNFQ